MSEVSAFLQNDPQAATRETIAETPSDEYMLIIPLISAECKVERQGKVIISGIVTPGMIHLASPNERWRQLLKTPSQSLLLSIPTPYFLDLLGGRRTQNEIGHVECFNPVLRPVRGILAVTRSLLPALKFDQRNRELLLDGVTRQLLALLFHEYQHEDASTRKKVSLSDGEMERCVAFAYAHMDAPMNVSSWCRVIGISPGEFSRRFRATTGLSPYRWFLDRRLKRAECLIVAGDLSLSEIALSLGFSSQSHFTEAFRLHAGLSPARWKNARQH